MADLTAEQPDRRWLRLPELQAITGRPREEIRQAILALERHRLVRTRGIRQWPLLHADDLQRLRDELDGQGR